MFLLITLYTNTLMVSTGTLALQHILRSLDNLVGKMEEFRLQDRRVKIGMHNRQIQIFTAICNDVFAERLWAVVNYTGGVILSACIYTLFVFHDELNALTVTGCYILITSAAVVCFLFLDVGGEPVRFSGKFLRLAGNPSWESSLVPEILPVCVATDRISHEISWI